ncbi:MAG: hypothetical protein H0W28_11510 [Pyrinomonadaceae bacterium]|nr:hypothetical protein [Pyrinomonadaceae bacterium]
MTTRKLFFGDNLEIMREHVADESVDLVYLDPPFNSNQSYNVLFKERDTRPSQAQIEAFDDTWHWTPETQHQFELLMTDPNVPREVAKGLDAFRIMLGENDVMAYLVMMAPRLLEIRRTLKPTGWMVLHCDQAAAHYLKVISDQVFDPKNFRNDVVWKRKAGRGETNRQAVRFGVSHDNLLFYAKTSSSVFERQVRPNNPEYIASKFTHDDGDGRIYRLDNITSPSFRKNLVYEYKGYKPPPNGWAVSVDRMKEMEAEGRLYFPDDASRRIQRKRYLDELEGETVDTLWDDIPPINSQAKERLGFPTQKPLSLLQRIIKATTSDDAMVLDPFCGCGTTIAAAEASARSWIGIDITYLAIALIEQRLNDAHPGITYEVHGVPKDMDGAKALFVKSSKNFEMWAVRQIGGRPQPKMGGDEGIDGVIRFYIDGRDWGTVLVSVKGGDSLNPSMVRDLVGTVRKDRAEMGILITRAKPTEGMYKTAIKDGSYKWPGTGQDYPRIQIVTVDDLLAGRRPQMPPIHGTYAEAPRAVKGQGEQLELG